METVRLVARLVMAAVFVVSGGAKLFDPSGTRDATAAFGVPNALVRPSSLALPWVELGTSVLLVVPATSWWGGLLALVLLAVFTVAISVQVGQGRAPACRCFGQLTPAPVNRVTILRNIVLAIPALVVVIAG